MADDPNNPQLPPFVAANLSSIVRVALAAVAGWLVQKGVITGDQTSGFITGGLGIALALATIGWAYLKNRFTARKLVAAAATGNPEAHPDTLKSKAAVSAAIADPTSPITGKAT